METEPGLDEVIDCQPRRITAAAHASLVIGGSVTSCSEFLFGVGFGDSRLHQSLSDTSSFLILVVIEFHRSLLTGGSLDWVPAI